MIVEDEQLIAHSIERSLLNAGYFVTAMATSAKEAFEDLEQTKPDLVLMDIHIQGPSDGVETARIIRERYHLPVIYLTAHADSATLDRAKITEPFGYLVKPLNHANLPSSIEMAIYKHKMERQLEEHRALLSTILQSIAEAVVVTDAAGQVQFMNHAAEALTEWRQDEANNRHFDEVVPLDSSSDNSLLSLALSEGRTVQIPRDTVLGKKNSPSIFVDGQIAISKAKGRRAGAMVTLHDATLRREEEQRIRQQQKMLSITQLAHDVACSFYGLFDLITSCSEALDEGKEDGELVEHCARLIKGTSTAGSAMAKALLDFGGSKEGLAPAMLQFNQILRDAEPLYNKICGDNIKLKMQLIPGLDLVLSHSVFLEKLAHYLVLSATCSMLRGGCIRLRTSNIYCPEEKGTAEKRFIRLLLEVEENEVLDSPNPRLANSAQHMHLADAIIKAIVTTEEGSITVSYESQTVRVTEVLLPSFAALPAEAAA
ncbi:MAG: response regulator [Acidobacteriota bacterium]|nr:response regulator [Acidobacteriota bacterium]